VSNQQQETEMEEGMVDISGLDKAEVLAALYNGSHQQGAGFLHAAGRTDMTVEQARSIISPNSAPDPRMFPWDARSAKELKFDYLHGRVLKIDLSGDTFRVWGYDRDNGQGAAERIITSLRESKSAAA